MGADPAVRVSVPDQWADIAGTLLMDLLGPFQEWEEGGSIHLLFYPFRHGAGFVADEEIRAVLPADPRLHEALVIERVLVPAGWEEGWKDHFKPLTVGRIFVRPPWEAPPAAAEALPPLPASAEASTAAPARARLIDVCLTPGLAFGTGLHPTTRGILELLQDSPVGGPLVDAGTGSGILAIGASLLGYAPVRAFDNDPLAVDAARSNAAANGVELDVGLADAASAPGVWFSGATVLANMTLEPVRELLGRLGAERIPIVRLLAAGILAGEQEADVLRAAEQAGLQAVRLIHESEWVSLDLRPGAGFAAPTSVSPIPPVSPPPPGPPRSRG